MPTTKEIRKKLLNLNVKTKLFPQSYVIDAVLANKQLSEKGYLANNLDTSILYRGDTRSPDTTTGIFQTGFYRAIEDGVNHSPHITKSHASRHCIATTKKLSCAFGFADFQGQQDYETYSWVYMFYSPTGIDLTKSHIHNTKENLALKVDEVALTGVSSENIIAALKIKTTTNPISFYYINNLDQSINGKTKSIPVVDLSINESCCLKEQNIELYTSQLNIFKNIYSQGYFLIPRTKKEFSDMNNELVQKLRI